MAAEIRHSHLREITEVVSQLARSACAGSASPAGADAAADLEVLIACSRHSRNRVYLALDQRREAAGIAAQFARAGLDRINMSVTLSGRIESARSREDLRLYPVAAATAAEVAGLSP